MTGQRRRNPVTNCPLTAALAVMGGKWKLIIIYWLSDAPRHFEELKRLLPAISQKVLTEQLRELIAEEVVSRNRTGPVPAPVVYSLTDYGRTLLPVVHAIRSWGNGHLQRG